MPHVAAHFSVVLLEVLERRHAALAVRLHPAEGFGVEKPPLCVDVERGVRDDGPGQADPALDAGTDTSRKAGRVGGDGLDLVHLVDHYEVGIEVGDGAQHDVGHRPGPDLPALGQGVQVDRLNHETRLGAAQDFRAGLGRHLPVQLDAVTAGGQRPRAVRVEGANVVPSAAALATSRLGDVLTAAGAQGLNTLHD